MRISIVLLVIFLVAWLPVGSTQAASVTLNTFGSTNLTTYANDVTDSVVKETVKPAAVPFAFTSTSTDGGSLTESAYDLSDSGFEVTVDQTRVSALNGRAQAFGTVYFSVDEDVSYTASGSYAAVDADGRRLLYLSFLEDHTVAGTSLYRSLQESRATPNESFTLGFTEGDFENENTGSLTGTLLAGHQYAWFHAAYLVASPTASTSSASGSGNFALTFAAIPEPNTGLLVGLGLVALTASRRRTDGRAT
jgi:hypothetical protein